MADLLRHANYSGCSKAMLGGVLRGLLIAIHMLLTYSVVSCLAPADPAVELSTSNGIFS